MYDINNNLLDHKININLRESSVSFSRAETLSFSMQVYVNESGALPCRINKIQSNDL
jgi:hypothetical protein